MCIFLYIIYNKRSYAFFLIETLPITHLLFNATISKKYFLILFWSKGGMLPFFQKFIFMLFLFFMCFWNSYSLSSDSTVSNIFITNDFSPLSSINSMISVYVFKLFCNFTILSKNQVFRFYMLFFPCWIRKYAQRYILLVMTFIGLLLFLFIFVPNFSWNTSHSVFAAVLSDGFLALRCFEKLVTSTPHNIYHFFHYTDLLMFGKKLYFPWKSLEFYLFWPYKISKSCLVFPFFY